MEGLFEGCEVAVHSEAIGDAIEVEDWDVFGDGVGELLLDSGDVHVEAVKGDEELGVLELLGQSVFLEVNALDELGCLCDPVSGLVESDDCDGFVDAFGLDVEAEGVLLVLTVEGGPVVEGASWFGAG